MNKYRSRERIEEKIVFGFLKGLWWLLTLPFRLIFGKKAQNYNQPEQISITRDYVSTRWQEIEQLMALGQPSNFSRAILEADKLLDHILKGLRTPGLTMGDRLKASRNRFSPEGYNSAWQAHKVRNELVHNADYQIMDFVARPAIANFKKAIGELI